MKNQLSQGLRVKVGSILNTEPWLMSPLPPTITTDMGLGVK